MNSRSLLDYIDDRETPVGLATEPRAEWLEHRLAELEHRLAFAREAPEAARNRPPPFSSQIESILRRQAERPWEQDAAVMPVPVRSRSQDRERVVATPGAAADRNVEFAKFVEAVHLIGQAARRFLHEPPVRQAGPGEDTLALTAALRETVGAFQAMTADLATAASRMRQPEPLPHVPPERTTRVHSREDDELRAIERDLADLHDRFAALSRRRNGG